MSRTRKVEAVRPTNQSKSIPKKPLVEISEEEQWRIVKQSGLLNRVTSEGNASERTGVVHSDDNEDERTSFGEEAFNSILLIIPFSFLLLMMEILIHQQYGKRASIQAIVDRMVHGVPILSIWIFYTTRYKRHRRMQIFLFIVSNIAGGRMLYLINKASWLVNMRQCPPLATIWVYTIAQLDLGPAVLSLAITASYVWWAGLKLHF